MIIARFLPFFPNSAFLIKQKNKVRSGSSLRGGVVGSSFGASSFRWFLGGFGRFLLVEGDFRWFRCFAVLVVTSISQHTEHLTLYCTHGRT